MHARMKERIRRMRNATDALDDAIIACDQLDPEDRMTNAKNALLKMRTAKTELGRRAERLYRAWS